MFRFLRRRPKRDTPSLPTKLDLEVREEIRFYLEMRTRELIDEGLSPDEARRTAIAAFGEPESVAACSAVPRQVSGVHDRCRVDARPRYRGEHRDVQFDQQCGSAPVPFRGRGSFGASMALR
jgi:hypothetical protein